MIHQFDQRQIYNQPVQNQDVQPTRILEKIYRTLKNKQLMIKQETFKGNRRFENKLCSKCNRALNVKYFIRRKH